MSVIQLSDSELSLLRMHTLSEYNQTLKKLEELNIILKKLGIGNGEVKAKAIKEVAPTVKAPTGKKRGRKPTIKPVVVNETITTAPKKRGRKPSIKTVVNTTTSPIKTKVAKAEKVAKVVKLKKTPKGKRISWAKFVVSTLKASKTPMSAPELLEAGKTQFAVTDANRNKAMQALQATLFRLSKKSDVLGAEKTKGSFVGYFLKKK